MFQDINPEIKSLMQLGMSRNLRFALVKFGGGIIEMRGSLAGNVFSRNKGGNYARAKTTPINPNTANQVAVRAALAQLTDLWSNTVTPAQRAAWNLYAANVQVVNKLGESVNISGFNHYIRSNVEFLRNLAATTAPGPVVFEIPEQDPTFAITASEATQQISVTFNNALDWANETGAVMFVYQGQPQNAQRNFFGGPWRYMDRILGDGAVPPVSPDVMDVPIVIAEGQRQWVYARIRRVDGRLSEPFRSDVLVGA